MNNLKIEDVINLHWDDTITHVVAMTSVVYNGGISDMAGEITIDNGHPIFDILRYRGDGEDQNEGYKAYLTKLDNLSSLPETIHNVFTISGRNGDITITHIQDNEDNPSYPSIPVLLDWLKDNELNHTFLMDKESILDSVFDYKYVKILLESNISDQENPNVKTGYLIIVDSFTDTQKLTIRKVYFIG